VTEALPGGAGGLGGAALEQLLLVDALVELLDLGLALARAR
jgi:hypothetical protein